MVTEERIQIRPYQAAACAAVEREWERGIKRTLMVLPTGTGKTICFCQITVDTVRAGGRVLILAHRGELLDQAADKLKMSTGLDCAIEKADQTCMGEFFRVVVGSIQTMMRPSRLEQFPTDYFDVIIVDEAHHALSPSYLRVLDYFEDAKVLGVTATPDRGDMKNLGKFFESLAYEYTLPKAIKDGFLSPIKAMNIPLNIDLAGVKTQSGDYQAAGLGTALEPYLERIAAAIKEHCAGRKVVAFLPLIATSQKFATILRRHGVQAMEVNGDSPDRAEILSRFDRQKSGVLCNAMLLTEGWDCPSVDTIVVLRPTKIRSLYCQMVGRGTRLYPGKEYLLLLDFLWMTETHNLCRPAHLISPSEDVAAKMTENIAESDGPTDIIEAEEQAESDIVTQREEALAARLAAMRKRCTKLVDPLQFEMSIHAADLANYIPAIGWEAAPVSDAQKSALEKAGIFPDEIECAGKASLILDRIQTRRAAGLTTPKQIRFLEGRGFLHVGQWNFDTARRLIDRIAANNWRTPSGITPEDFVPPEAGPKPAEQSEIAF